MLMNCHASLVHMYSIIEIVLGVNIFSHSERQTTCICATIISKMRHKIRKKHNIKLLHECNSILMIYRRQQKVRVWNYIIIQSLMGATCIINFIYNGLVTSFSGLTYSLRRQKHFIFSNTLKRFHYITVFYMYTNTSWGRCVVFRSF